MRGGWHGGAVRALLVFAFALNSLAANAVVSISAAIHGYAHQDSGNITWVSITLSNPSTRPVEGMLEFTGYGFRGNSSAEIKVAPLPPGGSRTLNVSLPVITIASGQFRESNGDKTPLNLSSSYNSNNNMVFLYASDQANRLTDDELDAFTYRIAPDTSSGMTGMGFSGSPATTRSLTAAERVVSQITTDALPENWLCYTPLKTVIIPASEFRRLSTPRRQAIETWLGMGGNLVLFGEDDITSEAMARGRIYHTPANPIIDVNYRAEEPQHAVSLGQRVSDAAMPYRQATAGGRGGAFALATIFLIVVGPVNYWYFSRRNQIRKLLVTVPLISLGFCSLIAVYFVLTQGFNRKGGSLSITIVDEQSNRAVSLAKHSLLSGLYPLGGFHFSAETYLHPKDNEQRDSAQFDLTREIVLESGLFRPGIPFDYSTIKPYTTRERMMYDSATGNVRNGFELPLKAVAVLHEGLFYTGGATASGGQVKMVAVDEAEAAAINVAVQGQSGEAGRLVRLLGRQLLDTEELDAAANLAADALAYPAETSGTLYVALLDGIPKSAEPGVNISDGRNLHLVIGRTSPEEVE